MVLLESTSENIGTKIINFKLKGIDNQFYSLEDFIDKDILVIIFICNHCPYVKAVINRIIDLQEQYSKKNVQIIGINSNDPISYPEDSFGKMKEFARKYKINFPYLVDETQEIAKLYNAVCTPDIFVFDRNRILKYRGRLDDSWKDETKVKSKDLEKAINLLLENESIDIEQIPSMGCSIKWKI